MAVVAGRIRTFVALDLPEPHREALARYLADCARLAPGFRWVEPDALHLTLRFLGHVDLLVLDRVRVELASIHVAPFSMALGGRGAFGGRPAPRVVWLSLREGADACAALAERVESACAAVGLEPDPRRFRAHVTLARAGGAGERLPPLPEPPRLDPWRVEDFVLYESRLRQQPRYVPLERYPLG